VAVSLVGVTWPPGCSPAGAVRTVPRLFGPHSRL